MKTIFYVSDLVEDALKSDPKLRDDDNLLYIKICQKLNPVVLGMEFSTVLEHRASLGIPSIETVGRCRRKLQEFNPELRASKKATDARYDQFKEVMEYVSSE